MDKKNHVPDGCYLTCDKGSSPCRLKVTNHNNVRIYGDNLASEADLLPNKNVFPMGGCAVTQGACMPQPLYWDKTTLGITVNGYKLLVDEAKLLCAVGGQIAIHFSHVDALIAVGAPGLGFGAAEALRRLEGTPSGMLPDVLADQRAKLRDMGGQFSERFQSNYHATETTLPVEEVRWSQTTAKRTFDDGRLMENSRNTVMRRGRVSKGTLPPSEAVRMSDGGYTVLDHRRGVTAVEAGATEIPVKIHDGQAPIPPDQAERFELGPKHKSAIKRLNADAGSQKYEIGSKPSTYEEAAKFRAARQNSTFPLNGSHDLPRISGDPPVGGELGVLKPPSRTTQFLANVSESIQSRPGIARANEYMIRNAEGISKVGKVAGRGLIVIGIAVDAYRITKAYEADGEQVGQQTLETTGSAVGGLAGAWAGAEIGATIGMVGGPVGVVVGGLVGGVIGGFVGSSAGQGLVHGVGEFLGSW
jgi:hypothetical protein